MPRLIDENKAKEVLTDYYHIRTEIQQIAMDEAFSRVPTVEAIPKEWIKEWCNTQNGKSLEERLLKRYGVLTLLEDWEKENGRLDR